jgi:hypothetical protein
MFSSQCQVWLKVDIDPSEGFPPVVRLGVICMMKVTLVAYLVEWKVGIPCWLCAS